MGGRATTLKSAQVMGLTCGALRVRCRHAKNPRKTAISGSGAAPGAAPSAENGPHPADLDPLTDGLRAALLAIPEAERGAVVAHVEALADMSPARRAALLTLTGDAGLA